MFMQFVWKIVLKCINTLGFSSEHSTFYKFTLIKCVSEKFIILDICQLNVLNASFPPPPHYRAKYFEMIENIVSLCVCPIFSHEWMQRISVLSEYQYVGQSYTIAM
jgi:hypothetical protein